MVPNKLPPVGESNHLITPTPVAVKFETAPKKQMPAGLALREGFARDMEFTVI